MSKLISILLIFAAFYFGKDWYSDKDLAGESYSCKSLIGTWEGTHNYPDGTNTAWSATYHVDNGFDLYVHSEKNQEKKSENLIGVWRCDGKVLTLSYRDISGGETVTRTFRILELTEETFKYQWFTKENNGSIYLSKRSTKTHDTTIKQGHPAALSVTARPLEREALKYEALLIEGKYEDLDTLAELYLKTQKPISDGQPAMAALHLGLSDCLTRGCAENPSHEIWAKKLGHLEKWNSQYPSSFTAKVAIASYYAELAWEMRGRGYASSITEEEWENFRVHIGKSRVELETIAEQGESDPRWYHAMLTIGIAQAWPIEEFEHIYRDGIKKYPLYLPLYFSKSLYLSPRWHGSTEEQHKHVEEVVLATKKELGEVLYARLNWASQTNDMFANGQVDWGRMKQGFERMVSDYPDPWNINNFAKFACIAEDWNALNGLTKDLKKNPVLAAWSDSQRFLNQCIGYAEYMVNQSAPPT